ncbi:MAG TPA: YciI family protein [Chryseosolibacter sp.]
MKDFLLVFRTDYGKVPFASPDQMQALAKKWADWFSALGQENRLSERGNRLVPKTGKVVKAKGVVTDGPYMEIKEAIAGYAVIRAASLEDAATVAAQCPVLSVDGSVEIREIMLG